VLIINGLFILVADLPGWPLLSPPKVQLQKCDKCSLEFCSTISYRRHTRVHRRSLNIIKVLFFLLSFVPFSCVFFEYVKGKCTRWCFLQWMIGFLTTTKQIL